MEEYREISLTRGMVALVDAADYEWLNSMGKWQAVSTKRHGRQSFYAGRHLDRGTFILTHRVILGLGKGDKRKGDHIKPGQTLDNRRSNLRIATDAQSVGNTLKRRDNTSGFKGVCWHKQNKRWYACISINGKQKSLGTHETPEKAHAAYCEAARAKWGEFANFG